jgi:hypothetical protein
MNGPGVGSLPQDHLAGDGTGQALLPRRFGLLLLPLAYNTLE